MSSLPALDHVLRKLVSGVFRKSRAIELVMFSGVAIRGVIVQIFRIAFLLVVVRLLMFSEFILCVKDRATLGAAKRTLCFGFIVSRLWC
jgi:hypothetical protein